jgi:hypothetical protein
MSREVDAEIVSRHINENLRLIVRQRNLVAFLKASDYDTAEAERNLAALVIYVESLEAMQARQPGFVPDQGAANAVVGSALVG